MKNTVNDHCKAEFHFVVGNRGFVSWILALFLKYFICYPPPFSDRMLFCFQSTLSGGELFPWEVRSRLVSGALVAGRGWEGWVIFPCCTEGKKSMYAFPSFSPHRFIILSTASHPTRTKCNRNMDLIWQGERATNTKLSELWHTTALISARTKMSQAALADQRELPYCTTDRLVHGRECLKHASLLKC